MRERASFVLTLGNSELLNGKKNRLVTMVIMTANNAFIFRKLNRNTFL